MIRTPVKFDSFDDVNGIFDRTGNAVVFTDTDLTKDDAEEIVKRINLHEKLIILLKESKFALSQQYGVDSMFLDEVNNVLEQCK